MSIQDPYKHFQISSLIAHSNNIDEGAVGIAYFCMSEVINATPLIFTPAS